MARTRKRAYEGDEGDEGYDREYDESNGEGHDSDYLPPRTTRAGRSRGRNHRPLRKRRKVQPDDPAVVEGPEEADVSQRPYNATKKAGNRATRSGKRIVQDQAPNPATTPQNASSVVVSGCTINGVPATTHEIIGIFRAAWAKRDGDALEWKAMYDALKLELEETRTVLQKTKKELKTKKGHIRTLKRAIEVQK